MATSPTISKPLGRIEYKVRLGKHLYVRPGGVAANNSIELKTGSWLAFDWLWFREGPVCYTPDFDDSRMVPYGETIPSLSEEDINAGYKIGLQVHALVHHIGLVTFTDTSGSATTALQHAYEHWLASPDTEDHRLTVYRIEAPRSYTPKRNPKAGILHAPVYRSFGAIHRDPKIFGAPLRDWPKVSHADGELPLPPVPEDRLFAQLSAENEVVSNKATPRRTQKTVVVPLPSGQPGQSDPDLDDEVKF
jgi:hypothetical protein